jgi:hypothetical protein
LHVASSTRLASPHGGQRTRVKGPGVSVYHFVQQQPWVLGGCVLFGQIVLVSNGAWYASPIGWNSTVRLLFAPMLG